MTLDNLLYDDGDGVFAKLRRGDYEKDEAQLDLIRKFAGRINEEIRAGKGDPREVIYIVAIVHDLLVFSDEVEWAADFATEIYHTVNFMVEDKTIWL